MSKQCTLVALLWLSVLSSLSAQGSFTTTSGASVRISGAAYLKLHNTQWHNDGALSAGASAVEFSGNQPGSAYLAGFMPDVFKHLRINRSAGTVVLLKNAVVTGNLDFSSGLFNLNGFNVTLAQPGGMLLGENETSRAFSTSTGELQLVANLSAPAAANPANLGAALTSAANLGATVVRRGHLSFIGPCNGSIMRYFAFQPANNSGLNATLRMYYFDAELNGAPENELILYRSDNGGASWTAVGFDSRNAAQNWVEKTGLSSLSMFTLADANWLSTKTWYLDADNDNYYTGTGITQCSSPGDGYRYTGLTGGGDCKDSNAAINPGATEIPCNDVDENCNGMADDDPEPPAVSVCPVARTFTGCNLNAITGPTFSPTAASSSYAEFSHANNQGAAADNCAIVSVTYRDVQTSACPITVARTWTLGDGSATTSCVQTIQVNAPAVQLACPNDASEPACQSQTAIDAAFADWLADFGFSGGCSANGAFDGGTPVAPGACGGSVTVTYRVTSICAADAVCAKTFAVANAPAVQLNCPNDASEPACQSQTAIDAAFADWIADFGFSGGCSANSTFDGGTPVAPGACGGSVTATYRVTSACAADAVCTKTFAVANAPAVQLACPNDASEPACQSQTAIDAAFADWLADFGFSGGCSANGAFDGGTPVAPGACGGSVTATYRVTSACVADAVCTKTFTVANAPAVQLNCPNDASEPACQSQIAIDAAFADWLADFGFSGGCSANGAFDGGTPVAPGACGGSVTATYRVTSACVADAVCTKTFAVANAPVILDCPASTTVSNCQTQAQVDNAFAAWLAEASFSGGCVATLSNNAGAAPLANGGFTTVEFRVQSVCQSDVTCSRTFTVTPATGISLPCPLPIVRTTSEDLSPGDCISNTSLTHPLPQNGCPPYSLVVVFSNGTPTPVSLPMGGTVMPGGNTVYPFAAGQTVVTYQVSDAYGGNSTQCVFTVTVMDDELPLINCPGPVTVSCSGEIPPVNLNAVTVSDACGGVTESHDGDATINMFCANRKTIIRTYRAVDAANIPATCTQVITVFDNTQPVFTSVPGNAMVQCNSIPAVGVPTASDNCGGAVSIVYNGQTNTPGSCPDAYTLTRKWTATDACGNTRTATQAITVRDAQKPTFTGTLPVLTVQCNAIPAPAMPTATDNCDAAVAVTYIGQTITSGTCPDSYTLTRRWVAADNCGNTRSVSQRINVVDNTKPVFTGLPPDATISCNQSLPALGTPTATDGCATPVITYLGANTVSGACPGNYQVKRTWRATDDCGNSTVATQTIAVQDNTPPVFTSVPPDATIQCNQSLPPLSNPTATDACGGYVSITYLGQATTGSGCSSDYTVTRTWRAQDMCGLLSTAQQVITVTRPNYAPKSVENREENAAPLITHRSSLIINPNPTTDRIAIDLSGFTGEAVTVSIFSDLGRLVWQRKLNARDEPVVSVSLREAGAPACIFTLHVQDVQTTVTKRVVLVD